MVGTKISLKISYLHKFRCVCPVTTIGTDASLATTKTRIVSFALFLKNALALQTNQVKSIDSAILVMETACNEASDEAFKVYGCLITKFYKTPKSADFYFPIALLQSVSQSTFEATLITKAPKKIFKRKLDIVKHTLRFTNIGTEIVHAYFTNGLTDVYTAGTPVFVIQPNTIVDCNPATAGYTDDKRHLHIVNTGLTTASIEIDIMVAN